MPPSPPTEIENDTLTLDTLTRFEKNRKKVGKVFVDRNACVVNLQWI